MPQRERGLYELLITEALDAQLRGGATNPLQPARVGLRDAEAAQRIALHLARVIERAIESVAEKQRASVGVALARSLIDVIASSPSASELSQDRPVAPGEVLRAMLGRLPDGRVELIAEPLIPLLDTTLLTNAPGEPRVGNQVLARVLATRVEHVPVSLAAHPHVPLQIHARYSRLEILAAFGVGKGAKIAAWQTGVLNLPEEKVDLLAFTLDKTVGQFPPSTRYRDYAINRTLIHWESQSVTRADSETGLRYQGHEELGTSIMLFARLRTDERAFYFLGPASYVKHESERPMAVTWKLEHALPGDLFVAFAAAVA
jgi:hypothetical protein